MTIAAVGQFCAISSVAINKTICRDLIKQAANLGAKMIFLPEASDFIAKSKEETKFLTTSIDESEFISGLKEVAKNQAIWVSVGVHEKTESSKIFNTHLVINAQGDIISKYRKIHLFDVDIKDGPRLMESDTTQRGDQIGIPVETPVGKLGLQTCYDMRFAESSIALRRRGAELLAFPSAFTVKTGIAHWETLLRARAIETQTYVFAAAQIGQHNEKRASYGHSMIIDPWGTVIGACQDNIKPSLTIADIDLDYMNKIRIEMPVMEHRRIDLYPHIE